MAAFRIPGGRAKDPEIAFALHPKEVPRGEADGRDRQAFTFMPLYTPSIRSTSFQNANRNSCQLS